MAEKQVAKFAQRSNLAERGLLGKGCLYFVFDHVCLFILGVRGADLSSPKGKGGMGTRGKKDISVFVFCAYGFLNPGAICSLGCMRRLRNSTTTHIQHALTYTLSQTGSR